MLKLTPQDMKEGLVTSILITDDKFHDVIEIVPIPFERIIQDDVKRVVSLYYLKKKTCETLIQQLEIAQVEFAEAKANFESMTNPQKEPERPYPVPKISKEPIAEPEAPKLPIPEPTIRTEQIVSAPVPPPPSAEEIVASVIDSDEFRSLIVNDQVSDTTIRSVISNITTPEMVDTIYDMIMVKLKDEGAHGFKIEPSFMEKAGDLIKKRGRKSKTT